MKDSTKIILALILIVVACLSIELRAEEKMTDNSMPIATKWLLDSIGETGRATIDSVFLIYCHKTQSKGSGFLIKEGYVITNYHVVEGCNADDIMAVTSDGSEVRFKKVVIDKDKDIAALEPIKSLSGGLELDDNANLKVGMLVSAWGHPLGYNGPSPLLTMGYLSGFNAIEAHEKMLVKHLVINGAFNPGNSGGPLLIANDNKVIGIVVSKHVPVPKVLKSALTALEKNPSGMQYTGRDEKGTVKNYSEAQIVAELLKYHQSLTQVVIGEAIAISELRKFLKENNITNK